MGIRIKKTIGYAVKDVITDDWRMGDDPRFNKNFWNEDYSDVGDDEEPAMERYSTTRFPDFEKWVKSNYDLILDIAEKDFRRQIVNDKEIEIKKEDKIREIDYPINWMKSEIKEKGEGASDFWFTDFCVHDFEFGLKVMLFKPPSYKDWQRRDNIIDYCEANIDGNTEPYVKDLPASGIYPHLGMIRFRDATSEVSEALAEKHRLMPAEYSMLVGRWSRTMEPGIKRAADLQDLEENWRCQMPIEMIMAMAFINEGFTDLKSFLNELRPMLYVYWS